MHAVVIVVNICTMFTVKTSAFYPHIYIFISCKLSLKSTVLFVLEVLIGYSFFRNTAFEQIKIYIHMHK